MLWIIIGLLAVIAAVLLFGAAQTRVILSQVVIGAIFIGIGVAVFENVSAIGSLGGAVIGLLATVALSWWGARQAARENERNDPNRHP